MTVAETPPGWSGDGPVVLLDENFYDSWHKIAWMGQK